MSKKLIVGIIVFVLLVWLIVGFIPIWTLGGLPDAGLFGDSFGFVNSLISGLALAGVIVAVRMQAKELHNSAIEQHETAIAQRASAEAQRRSVETLMLSSYINAAISVVNAPLLLTIEQEQSLSRVKHAMELAEQQLVDALPLKVTPNRAVLVFNRLHDLVSQVKAFDVYPQNEVTRKLMKESLPTVREKLMMLENDIAPVIFSKLIGGVDDRLNMMEPDLNTYGPNWDQLKGNLNVLANILASHADEFMRSQRP